MTVSDDFGRAYLKEELKKAGLSQADLARKMGVSATQVSSFFRGKMSKKGRVLFLQTVKACNVLPECCSTLLANVNESAPLKIVNTAREEAYQLIEGTQGARWIFLPNHRWLYYDTNQVRPRLEASMRCGVHYVFWGGKASGIELIADMFGNSRTFGEVRDKLVVVQCPEYLSYCPYIVQSDGGDGGRSRGIIGAWYVQTRNQLPSALFPIEELTAMQFYDALAPTIEKLLRGGTEHNFELLFPKNVGIQENNRKSQ